MPIYGNKCRCGAEFEAVRRIDSGDEDVACPKCGEKKPARVITAIYSRIPGANQGNLRFPT